VRLPTHWIFSFRLGGLEGQVVRVSFSKGVGAGVAITKGVGAGVAITTGVGDGVETKTGIGACVVDLKRLQT